MDSLTNCHPCQHSRQLAKKGLRYSDIVLLVLTVLASIISYGSAAPLNTGVEPSPVGTLDAASSGATASGCGDWDLNAVHVFRVQRRAHLGVAPMDITEITSDCDTNANEYGFRQYDEGLENNPCAEVITRQCKTVNNLYPSRFVQAVIKAGVNESQLMAPCGRNEDGVQLICRPVTAKRLTLQRLCEPRKPSFIFFLHQYTSTFACAPHPELSDIPFMS
eukprot:scpid71327/ scgid13463/ 